MVIIVGPTGSLLNCISGGTLFSHQNANAGKDWLGCRYLEKMKMERSIAYYVITTTTTTTTDINYSDNYIITTVPVHTNNRFKVKTWCKYQNHVKWERPSLG